MKKKHLMHCILMTLFLCICVHSKVFGGALPVSPSSELGVAKVATNCPTFSWAQEEGASAYGIEVYELKSEQVPTREEAITQRNPVISKSIPAPALSWTPSAEACLEPGKRYVWFVKAEYEDGTNEWSEGKVFETQKASDLVNTMVEQEVRKYMEEEGLDYLSGGTGLSGDAFIVEREAQKKAAAISGKNAGRYDLYSSQGLNPLATEGLTNVFFGQLAGGNTGTGDEESCTFIGGFAGYGNLDDQGYYNTYVGYLSGYISTNSDFNTYLGYKSGVHAEGAKNTLIGAMAGQGEFSNHFTGSENVFVGYKSGSYTTSGYDNVFVGTYSGYLNKTGHGNVFLGYKAGTHETGSNKLYIENSITSNPLIYGDFSSDILTVNGRLGIWTKNPKTALDLNGGTLTIKGTDTSAGGTRLPKLNHIETGRFDMGWGGAGGGNLEFYSRGHSTKPGQFRFVYGGGNFGEIRFIHYDGSSWTNYMTLTKNGHLNMLPDGSTVRAYCDGYTWHDSSSREFKKEIRKLDAEEAFSAFTALEPVTYKYKGTDELRVGFIAEDVPELVATKDRKSLVAMDIVAVLTKVVQEQQKEIAQLKEKTKEIATLKAERAEMSSRIARLEKLVRAATSLAMAER